MTLPDQTISNLNVCILNPQNPGWEVVTSSSRLNHQSISEAKLNTRFSHPVYLDKLYSYYMLAKTSKNGRWDLGFALTRDVSRSFLLVIHLDGGSRSNMPIEHFGNNLRLIKSKGINVSNSNGYIMFFQILNESWSLNWDVKCPVTEWLDRHSIESSVDLADGFGYSNLSELRLPLA
jgi:hypothetical protein